ncbi:MAG: hypothetical protein HFE45_12730 [Oscillospiraceae bacterium]|jgi:ribosomal protein L14E/L6E/L27E|nr:hypothetical protein [Oscillospiraceae bacterium]
MGLTVGMVVRNRNGHDKGFFVVVKIGGGFVYIANGRSRLLEKPKKKNPKHLSPTGAVLEMENITTDRKLRAALWPLNFGPDGRGLAEGGFSWQKMM